jgi:hypothetical protein
MNVLKSGSSVRAGGKSALLVMTALYGLFTVGWLVASSMLASDEAPETLALLFTFGTRVEVLLMASVLVLTLLVIRWVPLPALRPGLVSRRVAIGLGSLAALSALGALLRFPEPLLVLALSAVVWILGRRFAGRGDRQFLILLGTAFALRCAMALVLMVVAMRLPYGQPVVFDDEVSYRYAGFQVIRTILSGSAMIHWEWRHLGGPYLDVVGLSMGLPGADFTIVRFVNATLSTLTVALIVGIARKVWGEKEGLAAGWVAALWPSLVLWSGSGLKEPSAWFCSSLVAWVVLTRLPTRGWARWVAAASLVVLLLFVLADLRWEATLAIVGAGIVALWLALWREKGARLAIALVLVGSVAAAVLGFVALRGRGPELFRQFSPRALEYRAGANELTPLLRYIREVGLPDAPEHGYKELGGIVRVLLPGETRLETAALDWYSYDPPGYLVVVSGREGAYYVPPERLFGLTDETVGWDVVAGRFARGLGMLFIPPLPGSEESVRRLMLAPDVLAWTLLTVSAAVVALRRKQTPTLVWLWLVPVLMVFGLGIASTNLGTLARHRDLVLPWLAILVAPAVPGVASWAWRSTLGRRSRTAVVAAA